MRRVSRLVARVLGLEGAANTLEGQKEIPIVNELIARIVGHRMLARIHPDGVARARLDAVAAEDASELVDDELHGIPLVPSTRITGRVLARVDEDALGGARRRTAQARHAAHTPVLARRKSMNAAKSLGIRALLLGVR